MTYAARLKSWHINKMHTIFNYTTDAALIVKAKEQIGQRYQV